MEYKRAWVSAVAFDAGVRASKARASELQARVPKVRDEVRDRLPELGNELRARSSGISQEIARQYAKMDVSWARRTIPRAVREGHPRRRPRLRCCSSMSSRRVGGREVLGEEIAASGDLRRQPLQPSGHADDPARDAAQLAQPDRGRGRRRLLLQVPLARPERRARASTPSRSAATAAGSATARQTTSTQLIEEGWNLLMFPEGTRSRDGELGKVRSGAAVLAAAARAQHRPDLGRRAPTTRCRPARTGRSGSRAGCSRAASRSEVRFGVADPAARIRPSAAR